MPTTRVVQFTDSADLEQKLRECIEYNKDHANAKLSFSEFLARTSLKDRLLGQKSDKDSVIADFSGLAINGLDLAGLDFGNSIFTNTTFTECNLYNTKLSSDVSMAGLRFLNGCNLSKATISGDLTGVYIGDRTIITELDLTNAIGIAGLNIDKNCKGAGIKIDFASTKSLQESIIPSPQVKENMVAYIAPRKGVAQPQQIQNPEQLAEFTSIAGLASQGVRGAGEVLKVGGYFLYDFASSIAQVGTSAAQDIDHAVQKPIVPMNAVAARQVAQNVVNGVRAAGPPAAPQIVPAADAPPQAITGQAAPLFTYSIKGQNLAAAKSLTETEIKEWVYHNKNQKLLSLEEFARSRGKDYIPPILHRLDLKDIDFNNLDFSGAIIADCTLTKCNFNDKSNLSEVTITGSKMNVCNFREVVAQGIDCSKSIFVGCEFFNSDLTGAKFVEATLTNTTLDHSKMEYANLQRSVINSLAITNSHLDHAKLSNVTGDELTIKQSTATHLDLVSAELSNLTINVSDLSHSIAHNAKLPGAKIKNATLNNLAATGIIMRGAEIADTHIEAKSDLSHGDFAGSRFVRTYIKNATMVKASFENADIKSCELTSCKAAGATLTGAVIYGDSKIDNVDLSNSRCRGFQIANSTILHSNLSGANLTPITEGPKEGVKTIIENVRISDTNLSDAKLNGATIAGGILRNTQLRGTDLSNATLGTKGQPTSIDSSVVMDQTTELKEIKLDDPKSKPTMLDLDGNKMSIMVDGKKSSPTLEDIKKECERVDKINNAWAPTKWVRALGNRALEAFKEFGSGAESVANSITERKTSRLGMILGVTAGVVLGTAIIAATAATLGGALIPVGGIVLGSCAVAGGIAGHVGANTSPGRRFFMIASTAASAVLLGPIGLVAAPAVLGYNMISGKRNAFSNAIGSTIKSIGNISKKIGQAISVLTYNDEQIVRANYVKEQADTRKDRIVMANTKLDAIKLDSEAIAKSHALYADSNNSKNAKQKTGFKLFGRRQKQQNANIGVASTSVADAIALEHELARNTAAKKAEAILRPVEIINYAPAHTPRPTDTIPVTDLGERAAEATAPAPKQTWREWGGGLWNAAKQKLGIAQPTTIPTPPVAVAATIARDETVAVRRDSTDSEVSFYSQSRSSSGASGRESAVEPELYSHAPSPTPRKRSISISSQISNDVFEDVPSSTSTHNAESRRNSLRSASSIGSVDQFEDALEVQPSSGAESRRPSIASRIINQGPKSLRPDDIAAVLPSDVGARKKE